jgi:hypothetical protein
MEVPSSDEPMNLTNREADVAIRVVYDRNDLPLNLHGLKGPELFGGVYMSRDLLAAWRAGAPDRIRWIVSSRSPIAARTAATPCEHMTMPLWGKPGLTGSSSVASRPPAPQAAYRT